LINQVLCSENLDKISHKILLIENDIDI